MKKSLLLLSLLAVLAVPAMAAPRDDDPRGGGRGVVKRIVVLLQRFLGVLDDEPLIGPPKP